MSNSVALLHVSDLHFGEVVDKSGEPLRDADVYNWWASHRLFDGFLGHHYPAISDLEELHELVAGVEGKAFVIVTGDLTRVGSQVEFDTAVDYLSSKIALGGGDDVGLELGSAWHRHAIPGNHDHWPGRRCTAVAGIGCIRGPNPGALAGTLGVYPRPCSVIQIGTSTRLRLFAIDSDDEVDPMSHRRVLARGHFPTQLQHAMRHFSAPKSRGELRGLLMHHSYAHRGYPLGITQHSRRMLESVIAAGAIDLVFTGHKHGTATATHTTAGRAWIELRCGTTTVLSQYPKKLAWLWPRIQQQLGLRKLAENTALVTRLTEVSSGQVRLEAQEWRRKPLKSPAPNGRLETPFEQSGGSFDRVLAV